jgi:hypothetical protein
MMQDRSLAYDIEAVFHLVDAGELGHHVRTESAPLAALRLA